MEGARAPKFRPYWIRYIVAFWAGEKLKWVRDNVLIACVCSIAPGLFAAGISAALSDDKWRAAAHATLLTYAGLFALFLAWSLISTPLELDRERQLFINGLTESLAHTKSKLAALRTSPPAIDVEILEIHVQAETPLVSHAPHSAIDCDIFLRGEITLRQAPPVEVVEYELSSVLHGNAASADYVDDIQHWGLVTEKKPVGIGTTFHYTVTKLAKLTHKLERRGVPVEGWLHFHITCVQEKEVGATVYRLTVLTPNGGVSTDTRNTIRLAGVESREFQKLPYAANTKGSVYQ